MKFTPPLHSGKFVRRYKRFFAEIEMDDERDPITAHVPNTGSLRGCIESPAPCRFTKHQDPTRKLQFTLQMIQTSLSWVGVNTAIPPALVWEAWEQKKISHWRDYDCAQREVKVSDESRIDLVLWNSSKGHAVDYKLGLRDCLDASTPLHLVEIKNVTLAHGEHALFPDCVSTRAQKHLRELMEAVKRGHQAEIFFVVQRMDCRRFRAAHEFDPRYADLLREAHEKGVQISAYSCELMPNSIELINKRLPVDLDPEP